VIAIALGAIVLGESITWRIAGGALLVLAAVAIVVRRESRQEAPVGVPVSAEPDDLVRTDGNPGELATGRVAKR
jgi:hypothetical protein